MSPSTKAVLSKVLNSGRTVIPSSAWLPLACALGLSPRELQIVLGVFDDKKEESIAAEMGISRHTVNTHFQRLYRKLNVCSRPQLILRVIGAYFALPTLDSQGSPIGHSLALARAHVGPEHRSCRSPDRRHVINSMTRYVQSRANRPRD
jgi:DNA-binding CsgD family transcriptional regulator